MRNRIGFTLTAAAIAAMALFGAGQALAETASGTVVANQATLDYQVNTIDQTQRTSNTVDFTVDKKIDLVVARTDGAIVDVTPGSTAQVLTFTVTNAGNDIQDIRLTSTAWANGTANPFGGPLLDSFDTGAVSIFVESGATAGYQVAEDTATFIDELASDDTRTVYIVSGLVDLAETNDEIAVYALVGEVRAGGSAGSEGGALAQSGAQAEDAVDIVFADAAGSDDGALDARHSAQDAFRVASATMGVTKSQAIDDGLANGDDYAIPGAAVTYTIAIANTGGATATSVVLVDPIPANTTYGAITTCNGTPGWHLISTGAWTAADPGNGSTDVDQIRCTIASIPAAGNETVVFTVTID